MQDAVRKRRKNNSWVYGNKHYTVYFMSKNSGNAFFTRRKVWSLSQGKRNKKIQGSSCEKNERIFNSQKANIQMKDSCKQKTMKNENTNGRESVRGCIILESLKFFQGIEKKNN